MLLVVCACAHMCFYLWRSEDNVNRHSDSAFYLFINPDSHWLGISPNGLD